MTPVDSTAAFVASILDRNPTLYLKPAYLKAGLNETTPPKRSLAGIQANTLG